ncbi:MAG: dihydrofolate reductase family protein [Armatimonadota bacterium]|nr:dihydrofolate reductase family protein [bacterium]MDW8321175.1 dihydrofolate reductase family protein [Armatimonadota bacterium]
MRCLLDLTGESHSEESLYQQITFPLAPPDRPYVFLNMVSTLDGKITLGEVGDTASGLGSPMDQKLMKRLQGNAQGVLIGASTLRAGHITYPPSLWRAVVTTSGNVPADARFFTESPGKAVVFTTEQMPEPQRRSLQEVAHVVVCGAGKVNLSQALYFLRQHLGVERLLCEGGGELNFEMFAAGLIDEWFLTLAPKVKGGRHIPTTVEGTGMPREQAVRMQLLSVYEHEGELYLRYRRRA